MSLIDDDNDLENTSINSEDDNIYSEMDINKKFRNNIVNCKKILSWKNFDS